MADRLSATDAAFLYGEDAATPMHVGGVVVIDPEDGFDFADVVELIRSRLDLVPRYRQKVRFVPARLGRPVWVDDDDFDLSYHVRRSALPKPGTRAQLDELVGRLISRPLDRNRPLWEMYVVEGLEGGRVALINKTHQALVDRMGAVDVAAAILDLARSQRTLPDQPWIPTPAPSDIDLIVDAVADVAARPSEALDALRLATVDLRTVLERVGDAAGSALEVVRRTIRPAPRSVLNQPTGGQRRFAGVVADLQQFKDIRKAHAGTVNDVILTVLTGALRNWLLSRGEPVTSHSALRAMVPVALRTTAEVESPPVASYLVDLPVAEPNPAMRLHQMSFAMGAYTESGTQIGADSIVELGRFAPPTLHALGARMAGQLSRRMYNVLVTNVPGPQIPLYAAGSKVVAMYPVAPLTKGHTLAVACTSYNGEVFFGLTADRDAMPDVEEFADLITEAIEELLHTVPPTARRRPPGRRRRSPTVASAETTSGGGTDGGGTLGGGVEGGPVRAESGDGDRTDRTDR